MTARSFAARIAGPALRTIAALALAVVASTSTAQAPVPPAIVDASGFEAPKFDVTFGPGGPGTGAGQLEGQTPGTFNGTWLRTKGVGLSSADVRPNAVGGTGAQVLRVDRAANSDDRWAVPVSGYPSIGRRYICIDWSMRVEQTVGPANTFGPFFGVEAYDDDATSLGLLGSLGVDASNGEVLYQIQDTGVLTAPGPTVAYGAWNKFQIELDFLTNTYNFGLNGVLLGSTGFVDHNNIPGGLNEFTDADIAAIAAAGDAASQALGGTAYFDNFLVTEGNVSCFIPEPSAMLLGAMAVGAAADRRGARNSRRRSAV